MLSRLIPFFRSRPVPMFVAVALISLVVVEPANAVCTAGSVLESAAETTPNVDFVDQGNGTVVHVKTGLIWKRCAEGQFWIGGACSGEPLRVDWAAALQMSVQSSFAAASDWRVPNRKELESIVEYCGHSPAINGFQFPPTPSERFWSSTSFTGDPGLAWDVYFSDGYSGLSNKTQSFQSVRLVRTAPAGSLLNAQSISFGFLDRLSVGQAATLSATASSGLSVVLTSQTPATCSVVGSIVSGLSEGGCIVLASQSGNSQFYPAEAIKRMAVGKLGQTISFAALPRLAVGATATVLATASSGLPVTLTSSTPAICGVSGDLVNGIAAGSCTLTATQGGNSVYHAATPVSVALGVGDGNGDAGNGGGDTAFSYPMALSAGWHLRGNSLDVPMPVQAIFGDAQRIESVWLWVPATKTWAFFSPQLSTRQLNAYRARNNLQSLDEIPPGRAYWLKLRQDKDFGPQVGNPKLLRADDLIPGWNLVTTGVPITPAELNAALAVEPAAPGSIPTSFVSLWAWDPARGRWLFYAPQLDAAGPGRLKEYIDSKGLLDFSSEQQTVGRGRGFWILK